MSLYGNEECKHNQHSPNPFYFINCMQSGEKETISADECNDCKEFRLKNIDYYKFDELVEILTEEQKDKVNDYMIKLIRPLK